MWDVPQSSSAAAPHATTAGADNVCANINAAVERAEDIWRRRARSHDSPGAADV